MAKPLARRDDVSVEDTWDLESMFPTPQAWEDAYKQLEAEIPSLAAYKDRLTESAGTLSEYLHRSDKIAPELNKLGNYAFLAFDVDTTNQVNTARFGRVQGLYARFGTATAFAQPEMLTLESDTIARFMGAEPMLKTYKHFSRIYCGRRRTCVALK